MLLDWLLSAGAFLAVSFLLGLPLALLLRVTAAERLCACAAISLGIAYLGGFASFLVGLQPAWALVLLAPAAPALWAQRPALRELLSDPEARTMLAAWAWVAAWSLALLSLVHVYSGGNLVGDWLEHYQRAFYYCGKLKPDYRFIGMYALPARPPLTNVVTAVLLTVSHFDFAHYQFFMTLQGSLCVLPLCLLARRLAPTGRNPAWMLVVLLALNPLFAENLVYPWTKLQSAFFILAGLDFFLGGRSTGSFARCQLAFAFLALGCLSHYSAAVYLVVLAALFAYEQLAGSAPFGRVRWGWGILASEGAAIFATWFPWSMHAFSSGTTYSSNTTVASYLVRTPGKIAHDFFINLYYTSVPHFLRGASDDFVATKGIWGPLRDYFFFAFQQELPLLAGFGGLVVLLWLASRAGLRGVSLFWGVFVAGVISLGVVVNDLINVWGYAHICCQALGLLGVALVAARWQDLPRPWRLIATAFYAVDLVLGIILPFCLQSLDLIRLVRNQGYTAEAIAQNYGTAGALNLLAKNDLHLVFFADQTRAPVAAAAALAMVLMGIGIQRASAAAHGSARTAPSPSSP
jgi:hypothetical protein